MYKKLINYSTSGYSNYKAFAEQKLKDGLVELDNKGNNPIRENLMDGLREKNSITLLERYFSNI